MYIYLYVYIYIYIFTYIFIYVHVCIYIGIYRYIFTHIYLYTYIYIHTHVSLSLYIVLTRRRGGGGGARLGGTHTLTTTTRARHRFPTLRTAGRKRGVAPRSARARGRAWPAGTTPAARLGATAAVASPPQGRGTPWTSGAKVGRVCWYSNCLSIYRSMGRHTHAYG